MNEGFFDLDEYNFNNDYFDPDDFLAEEQLAPCQFRIPGENLGALMGSQQRDVNAKVEVMAPLWLMTAFEEEQYLTRETARPFMSRIKNGILACPSNVDINSINPYFYNFSMKLAHSGGPNLTEDYASIDYLSKVYLDRLGMIFDQATSSHHSETDGQAFINLLDSVEKEAYRICQDANQKLKKWEAPKSHKGK